MIPDFKTKDELFKYLRENKGLLIIRKKAVTKFTDPLQMQFFLPGSESGIYIPKSISEDESAQVGLLKAKLAINTTNIMDSHSDVHIPGLWNKSLKERRDIYLLKEHKLQFENIIADDVKASAIKMSWKELGFKFDGETEVLIFDATIDKSRNEYMFDQYSKGRVKQHSVGMQYVKLFLCMNSESKWDQEEKTSWDKYISQVVNKAEAEAQGYFWAVTEAKVIEGSAVPLGSNFATPVISIEPGSSTQSKEIEPADEPLDYSKLALAFKTTTTN